MHNLYLVSAVDLSGTELTGNAFSSLFLPMLGVLFMLFFAYVFTKWILKRYKGISAGRFVKIIERTPIAQDKMLLLIEVNKQAYLLGIAGQAITTVCSFDSAQLPPKPEEPAMGFKSAFEEALKRNLLFLPHGTKNGDGETKGK